MNVLIPESSSPMGAELAASVRELGHAVFACHLLDPDPRCVADRGEACPLDAQPIDVAVLSGHAGGDTLTCAQRRRVPVAFVFRPDRRSVSAAIADATDDLAAHARVAQAAMHQALAFRNVDASAASATVRRRAGGLLVNLRLPEGLDAGEGNAVAVVVHDALRRYDRWANAVDIAVAQMTIEALDREMCLRLLATQTVGRVVVVDHGSPHIVPVNYALDGDAIVFRTAVGTKLDAASRSTVAFEVDDLHPIERTAWSVVIHGWAQEVTAYDDPALIARIEALPIDPWADFEKPYVVRIVPHTITGRRVSPTGRPPKAKEVLSHD